MELTARACRQRAAEYRSQARTATNEWVRVELLELAQAREQVANAMACRERDPRKPPAPPSDSFHEPMRQT
jgi:hypothetical protein